MHLYPHYRPDVQSFLPWLCSRVVLGSECFPAVASTYRVGVSPYDGERIREHNQAVSRPSLETVQSLAPSCFMKDLVEGPQPQLQILLAQTGNDPSGRRHHGATFLRRTASQPGGCGRGTNVGFSVPTY